MTIGTPMVIFAVLTVFDDWYTVCRVLVDMSRLVRQWSKTVKRQSKQQKMTIGVPIVTCLPRLYQQCTMGGARGVAGGGAAAPVPLPPPQLPPRQNVGVAKVPCGC